MGAEVRLAVDKLEAERAELDAILASEMLGRTNNLVRLLTFVCNKYFEGAIDQIKEYSIAVHALGRPADFDPQVDTIVRVTAHALRKRLEEYYRGSGASHLVHISLPPGHYVPKFTHLGKLAAVPRINVRTVAESVSLEPTQRQAISSLPPALPQAEVTLAPIGVRPARFLRMVAAIVIAGLLLSFIWYMRNQSKAADGRFVAAGAPAGALVPAQIIRASVGDGRSPYIDGVGSTWESDHYCTGGSSFSVPSRQVQGTEDPSLFLAGRKGSFHCNYAVPPGTYELHLLFAETAGLLENARNVAFSINGGPITNLDVVDDAGGDDIATTKVFTNVTPQNDGAIHVDFTSPDSFLNAIEILPSTPHRMLPVRILSGPSLYRDSNGNSWMPDHYFFGGRVNRLGSDLSRLPEGRLFEWHRYGHFHYTVPVAPGGRYTLRLYFLEHWFGVQNGSAGGTGSRVFNVSCNGSMLLKDFDIFREAGAMPLTKTFTHIEPTPQGKIEIYFTPGVNYPSVSALEILPE